MKRIVGVTYENGACVGITVDGIFDDNTNPNELVNFERVRHGHWKEKRRYEVGRAVDDDGWVELQELCSVCDKWAKTQWRSPLYCPNCGAKWTR